MRVTKRIRDEYETLLNDVGEARFYNHILSSGVLSKKHVDHPENTMVDQAEAFFALFRTTGNKNYFTIGKVLRRAAHKLYRESRRKCSESPRNAKFLYSV